MHKLIFRNKWFAAGWAAMTLFSIYMATPHDGNGTPGNSLAAVALGSGEADGEAALIRAHNERVRQAELAEFNAGVYEEPAPDDAESAAE